MLIHRTLRSQRCTLPRSLGLPAPAGIVFSVESRSAVEEPHRGGDLFDSYVRPDGSCVFLLADVSSKGELGIAHTDTLRRAFRAIAATAQRPAQILEVLNDVRFSRPPSLVGTTFASALVVAFEAWSAALRYASAGHDIGVIMRGNVHQHLNATGPVLGIFDDAEYADRVEGFAQGDLLCVATDGFTECRDIMNQGRQFGTSGIVHALVREAPGSCRALSQHVARKADAFTGGRYRDDATLAVITRSSAAD